MACFFILSEAGIKMLERLMHPAVLLVLIGALCAYGSRTLAGFLMKENANGELILKGIGCALAAAGALWLFMT